MTCDAGQLRRHCSSRSKPSPSRSRTSASTRSNDLWRRLLERVGVAGRGVELVALAAEPIGHRFQHVAIVINEQKLRFGHGVVFDWYRSAIAASCVDNVAPTRTRRLGSSTTSRSCCRQISTSQVEAGQRNGRFANMRRPIVTVMRFVAACAARYNCRMGQAIALLDMELAAADQ